MLKSHSTFKTRKVKNVLLKNWNWKKRGNQNAWIPRRIWDRRLRQRIHKISDSLVSQKTWSQPLLYQYGQKQLERSSGWSLRQSDKKLNMIKVGGGNLLFFLSILTFILAQDVVDSVDKIVDMLINFIFIQHTEWKKRAVFLSRLTGGYQFFPVITSR